MFQFIKEFIAIRMTQKGKKRNLPIEELEQKHAEPERKSFNDSSYFGGFSRDGFSIVTRQSFRVDKPNENWLKIHTPNNGVWGFENQDMPEGEGFIQGDLKWICTDPGKTWELSYSGSVWQNKAVENVEVNLTWQATSPILNFDTAGANPIQVGKQIAKETWSSDYFAKLKELKQVHIEQGGTLSGTITWQGEKHDVELRAVRDHSWGVRNWEDWDKHFWFLGILDDGSFFNISQISYGFVNNLIASFMYDGTEYRTLNEIPFFDEIGFNKSMPTQLEFSIQENKQSTPILIKIDMLEFFHFNMDGSYYIREAKAEFTFGDKKGIGVAEMGLNIKKYAIDVSNIY